MTKIMNYLGNWVDDDSEDDKGLVRIPVRTPIRSILDKKEEKGLRKKCKG